MIGTSRVRRALSSRNTLPAALLAGGLALSTTGSALAGGTGDLDDDGVVGPSDLAILLASWGVCPPPPCPADLDGDDEVGPADLATLLANWGPVEGGNQFLILPPDDVETLEDIQTTIVGIDIDDPPATLVRVRLEAMHGIIGLDLSGDGGGKDSGCDGGDCEIVDIVDGANNSPLVEIEGTVFNVQQVIAAFLYRPNEHYSSCPDIFELINVQLTVPQDPDDPIIETGDIVVNVTPVADPPLIEVEDTEGLEDEPHPLTLQVSTKDQDAESAELEIIDQILITDVPPGAAVTNATEIDPGVWALDITPGQVVTIDDVSILNAPNSSADFIANVRARSFEPCNEDTLEIDRPFLVRTSPVADTPLFDAPAFSQGTPGENIPFLIDVGLQDTDGSETFVVEIRNVPAGVTFSPAADLGGGVWSVSSDDLAGLTLRSSLIQIFNLDVCVVVTDTDPDDAEVQDVTEACETVEVLVRPLVYFVDIDAAPGGDGETWETAFDNVQSGLDAAADAEFGAQVWVAAGVYRPGPVQGDDPEEGDGGGDPRLASFRPEAGVELFGGFAGDEVLLEERDIDANLTVLSGDIGVIDDPSDNSYHVLAITDVVGAPVVDGFTITGGVADEATDNQNFGGGLYIRAAGLELSNCILFMNDAVSGGALYLDSEAAATVVDCRFEQNSGNVGGAIATDSEASGLNVTSCRFEGNGAFAGGAIFNRTTGAIVNSLLANNSALIDGGALFSDGVELMDLINCTIADNEATFGEGGGVYDEVGVIVIANSILWNNTANGLDDELAQVFDATNPVMVDFSCVMGLADLVGDGNIGDDPLFVSPGGGDYALAEGSPCIDAGDDELAPGVETDLAGNPRFSGDAIDMGAFEFQTEDDEEEEEAAIAGGPRNAPASDAAGEGEAQVASEPRAARADATPDADTSTGHAAGGAPADITIVDVRTPTIETKPFRRDVPTGDGPGVLVINGDAAWTNDDLTGVQVGAGGAAVGHDLFVIFGAAHLDGDLRITFTDVPQAGDVFPILAADAIHGDFNAIDVVGLPTDLDLAIEFADRTVTLVVTAAGVAPAPATPAPPIDLDGDGVLTLDDGLIALSQLALAAAADTADLDQFLAAWRATIVIDAP